MTYQCGMGAGIVGVQPRDPSIVCDGCGLVYRITARGAPPRWLVEGRAPRGWRKIGSEHYCMVRCDGKPRGKP